MAENPEHLHLKVNIDVETILRPVGFLGIAAEAARVEFDDEVKAGIEKTRQEFACASPEERAEARDDLLRAVAILLEGIRQTDKLS